MNERQELKDFIVEKNPNGRSNLKIFCDLFGSGKQPWGKPNTSKDSDGLRKETLEREADQSARPT